MMTGQFRVCCSARCKNRHPSKGWQERILQAQRLLSDIHGDGGTSATFAARMRMALAQNPQRVHACLAALDDLDDLDDLDFQGQATDGGFVQWQAW